MAKKITKPEGAPSAADAPKVRFVCAGRRLTTKQKVAFFWQRLDAPDEPLKGLSVPGGFVGKVIDLPMTSDGTYWPKSGTYVETLSADQDERVALWAIEDKAVFAAEEARKMEAKAKRDHNPLEDMTLREIREMAYGLTHMQRVGLTAAILRYVG